MPVREFASLFGAMSNRAFSLHLKDMDTLRNRFSRAQIDTPVMAIVRMKRRQLIHAILAEEFGGEAVMDYISQRNEWDEMKNFVEGRS